MATTISTQDLIDVKRDIEDIGKAANEKVIVSPRYGDDFKSLPMIADEAQATIGGWESAIALITQEGGVPALAVSDASGKNQQEINNIAKSNIVFPEHFDNDIIAAANYAAENGGLLVTANKTYVVEAEFEIPENTVWISNNTTVKQGGAATETRTAAGIAPLSNVRILGHLTVDMGSPTNGWGEKAHVRIDSFYNVTPQVKGFFFDTIKMVGGHPNANGFVMAGGASLVRGKRLEVDSTDKIGRVFMAHWGNFDQHYNDNGTYRHVAGYSPTTHPHDCIIDELVVGNMTTNTSDWGGLALVSAGYDIEIGRITGNLKPTSGLNNKAMFFATPGDLGFAYATDAEKGHKMRGLKIGEIVGESDSFILAQLEQALYGGLYPDAFDDYTNVPVQPTLSDYLSGIELTVDKIDVVGKVEVGNTTNVVLSGSNGGGKTTIGEIRGQYFYNIISIRNLNENLNVGVIYADDIKTNPVSIVGSGTDVSKLPKNTEIGKLVLNRYGVTSSSTTFRTVLRNEESINTRIGKIDVVEHGNAYAVVGTSSVNGENLSIGSINVLDTTYPQAFLVNNANRVDDPVNLETFYSAANGVNNAFSGGVSYKTNGRLRDYVSTEIRSNQVKVGDTYTVTSNPQSKYVCIANGAANATGVLKAIEASATFSQSAVTIPANSSVLLTSSRTISNVPMGTGLKAAYSVDTLGIILMPVVTANSTFSVYGYNPKSTTVELPNGNITASV